MVNRYIRSLETRLTTRCGSVGREVHACHAPPSVVDPAAGGPGPNELLGLDKAGRPTE